MKSWEDVDRLVDAVAEPVSRGGHSGSGLFVRLPDDGDSVVGAFCGLPYPHEVVWTGQRFEPYDPVAHADLRPKIRVAINFWVENEGDMKVFDGSSAWFKKVMRAREKYGLDKWLFEIKRHGAKGNPKTDYDVLPERVIDADTHSRIEACRLVELDRVVGKGAGAKKREGGETRSGSEARESSPGADDAVDWMGDGAGGTSSAAPSKPSPQPVVIVRPKASIGTPLADLLNVRKK